MIGRWVFDRLGRLAGRLLYVLARLALRIGDRHEFDHLVAALNAGDSSRCTDDHCHLRRGTVER